MTGLGSGDLSGSLIPGDVSAIRAAAAQWQARATTTDATVGALRGVTTLEGWAGDASEAYTMRLRAIIAGWESVAQAYRTAATALENYAGTLAWAQAQAAAAAEVWAEAHEATVSSLPFQPDPGEAGRAEAEEVLGDARAAVSTAGNDAAAAVRSATVDPNLEPSLWLAAGIGSTGTAQTVASLTALPAGDVAALVRLRPELADLLQAADDTQVAEWWQHLSVADQSALIEALPAVVGSLGGVSAASRVAANRFNAQARIAELDQQIREHPTAYQPGTYEAYKPGATASEQAELDYLQRVVDGAVQLYHYDPASHSVIKMIGTIGPDTSDINTYVPGTYTSMRSFYGGSVQQVGQWLNENSGGGIVTFVYKDGLFPGEDTLTGGQNIFRIGEANDESTALAAGQHIAQFQNELHAAVGTTSADYNAIAHSWGLAAVTSSEVADAQYTDVISLAGSGEPSNWTPRTGTDYSHFSYTDAVSAAQATGMVWDGHNPATTPAFDSTIYPHSGDYSLVIPQLASPSGTSYTDAGAIRMNSSPVETHNLIASDSAANSRALRDLLWTLQ